MALTNLPAQLEICTSSMLLQYCCPSSITCNLGSNGGSIWVHSKFMASHDFMVRVTKEVNP
jgi:uncharacterized protein YraI